jgi:hypothetical protein
MVDIVKHEKSKKVLKISGNFLRFAEDFLKVFLNPSSKE